MAEIGFMLGLFGLFILLVRKKINTFYFFGMVYEIDVYSGLVKSLKIN